MRRRWRHAEGARGAQAGCGPHRHWHEPRGRRLFWRVYLHGVVLLLVAGVTALAASGVWRSGSAWQRSEERIAEFVVADLRPVVDDASALQAKLGLMARVFEIGLAVYDVGGARLAFAGDDPPDALDEPPVVGSVLRARGVRAVRVDAQRYVVAAVALPWFPGRGALVVAAVLGVMALVSLPLARAITRPLERLTATARRFGQGDLAARTGIVRRDEVGDLARAFDEMAERVEQLVRSEKELLANVSHELRTPMARIRVALELCAEDAAPAEAVRDQVVGIEQDLAELERLVEDVLTAARLDAGPGAVPLRREPLDLAGVVRLAADRFAQAHPEHRLALELEAADTSALLVDGDPVLLRRVLDNLLDNAAKFAEPAAGTIELGLGPGDGSVAVLAVRDRGIGVAPADLARLAQPFFRTDRSRDRGTGGVGLGLYISRRVVEAHGGSLVPRAREGGGLVVEVKLPLALGAPRASKAT